VRIRIIGGGLAGALLAWRLAGAATNWRVDVVAGTAPGATGASGGAVRCFETDPQQRALAVASMAELLGSRVLREWADYRPTGSVYLSRDGAGLADAVAGIGHLLPGSASVESAGELAGRGFAGVEDAVAVVERGAGYLDPVRLRDAVLADAQRAGVTVLAAVGGAPRPTGSGTVACDGVEYDLVVLAAGPWTPALLAAAGLPTDGYRTKSIQYVVREAGAWRPPHFVDELTGLYGRPTGTGGLLMGLSTDRWDVDPAAPEPVAGLAARASELATARFPELRLGRVLSQECAADCYTDEPILGLRPVSDGVLTFTGGSGGSVKTVLAASNRAAVQLTAGVGYAGTSSSSDTPLEAFAP
jgi:glycine/D-amino acid oxidase-like deaminating enzyme